MGTPGTKAQPHYEAKVLNIYVFEGCVPLKIQKRQETFTELRAGWGTPYRILGVAQDSVRRGAPFSQLRKAWRARSQSWEGGPGPELWLQNWPERVRLRQK